MEKCTYCVQRITHARIDAEKQERKIRDGEVLTACQAVCPAQAIVFGDLNDPKSQVAQAQERTARLHAAGRSEHAAADDVSGEFAESESRDRTGGLVVGPPRRMPRLLNRK